MSQSFPWASSPPWPRCRFYLRTRSRRKIQLFLEIEAGFIRDSSEGTAQTAGAYQQQNTATANILERNFVTAWTEPSVYQKILFSGDQKKLIGLVKILDEYIRIPSNRFTEGWEAKSWIKQMKSGDEMKKSRKGSI